MRGHKAQSLISAVRPGRTVRSASPPCEESLEGRSTQNRDGANSFARASADVKRRSFRRCLPATRTSRAAVGKRARRRAHADHRKRKKRNTKKVDNEAPVEEFSSADGRGWGSGDSARSNLSRRTNGGRGDGESSHLICERVSCQCARKSVIVYPRLSPEHDGYLRPTSFAACGGSTPAGTALGSLELLDNTNQEVARIFDGLLIRRFVFDLRTGPHHSPKPLCQRAPQPHAENLTGRK